MSGVSGIATRHRPAAGRGARSATLFGSRVGRRVRCATLAVPPSARFAPRFARGGRMPHRKCRDGDTFRAGRRPNRPDVGPPSAEPDAFRPNATLRGSRSRHETSRAPRGECHGRDFRGEGRHFGGGSRLAEGGVPPDLGRSRHSMGRARHGIGRFVPDSVVAGVSSARRSSSSGGGRPVPGGAPTPWWAPSTLLARLGCRSGGRTGAAPATETDLPTSTLLPTTQSHTPRPAPNSPTTAGRACTTSARRRPRQVSAQTKASA